MSAAADVGAFVAQSAVAFGASPHGGAAAEVASVRQVPNAHWAHRFATFIVIALPSVRYCICVFAAGDGWRWACGALEHDDGAQHFAALHFVEGFFDFVEGDGFGYEAVEVESALQV